MNVTKQLRNLQASEKATLQSPDTQVDQRDVVEPQKMLSRTEAAQFLGISPYTLATWACTKRGVIPYVKIGKFVKYQIADLETYIASRTVVRAVA